MSHKPLAIRTVSLNRGAFAIPVVLTVLTSAPSTQAQLPCEYEVTAIIQAPECPPFGFPPTIGTAISEPINGGLPNVVGYYQSCVIGPDTAFVWIGNENKFITVDMPPNTLLSKSRGISPRGQAIVGEFDLAGDGLNVVAFLIDGGKFIEIPPLGGGNFSQAVAVNSERQVAGTTPDPRTGFNRAFRWEDGIITLIEPTFGPRTVGFDLSESGAVVGWMGTAAAIDSHAFLWNGRVVTDLGLAPNTFTTWANAVNNLNEVLVRGAFDENEPTDRINGSFVLRDGKFIDLGRLPGYDVIAGIEMNNDSEVVGLARAVQSSDEPDVGFIWQDRVMRNLNDLIDPDAGLTIKRAEAINQAGQITGRGLDDSGDVVAFVLTPIVPPLEDLDGDCTVGVADLLILLGNWGPCDNCENCPADLNGDCVVGVADLLILLANWSS